MPLHPLPQAGIHPPRTPSRPHQAHLCISARTTVLEGGPQHHDQRVAELQRQVEGAAGAPPHARGQGRQEGGPDTQAGAGLRPPGAQRRRSLEGVWGLLSWGQSRT